MIILDLTNSTSISKIEIFKIILHTIKVCLVFNWTLSMKINGGYIKITPTLVQLVFRQKSKLMIFLKPYSRLNLVYLEELSEISNKIFSPTIIITDLVFLHDQEKLSYVHLPGYSPELIKKFDYTKDIGIYIHFDNWRDCEKVNLAIELSNEINVIKLPFPVKTIKKNHTYSDSARVFKIHNNHMKYEINENFVDQKVSVIIPSKFEYMVEAKFYGITSSCSMVIEQVSMLLKSLKIEFEIIVIVGPDVNQENLSTALSRDTKFTHIADEQDFNFSRRVNLGLQSAQYDLIWLINDDVEIIDDSSTLQDIRIAIELANRK